MQIDFHHAVTYVAARLAGFTHDEADIVAHASQYADDATINGAIHFDNGALYTRICSAHKTVDPLNLNEVENHMIWLPFHFLPGNGRLKAGADPAGKFIEKIICRPGNQSYVAKDMVNAALKERSKPNGLYRLGITLHVYADTWSHQGFAGVLHAVNDVDDLEDMSHTGLFSAEWVSNLLAQVVPAVGHGRAQVFPDMPFLSWKYHNGQNETITRNNTEDFCVAVDELCKVMQRYLQKPVTGIPSPDMDKIRTLFSTLKIVDGDQRHGKWMETIAKDPFSFGPADISYAVDGPKSWKADALGTSEDKPEYPYWPAFLQSKWKRFHDALQQHRLTMLHEILPKYGICAG